MKSKDLENLMEMVEDERDRILLSLCIRFMKKIEEIGELGIQYINDKDRFEFTHLIVSIVRTYLITMREHFVNEDDISAIINDLQSTLSPLFKIGNIGSGMKKQPQLLFSPISLNVENIDRQAEFLNILAPFISFIETNIYNCFLESYNNLLKSWHANFCELSAKASGIIKEKKKEGLPEIPIEGVSEKKGKTKK